MNNHRLNLISDSVAAIFILLFTYTAINKIFDINSFVFVLNKLKWIAPLAGYFAWLFIIAELITAALLLKRSARYIGLISSLVLMFTFTTYITAMLLFASKLPCSCGGIIGRLSWDQHLILNIVLVVMATIGLYAEKKLKSRTNFNLT